MATFHAVSAAHTQRSLITGERLGASSEGRRKEALLEQIFRRYMRKDDYGMDVVVVCKQSDNILGRKSVALYYAGILVHLDSAHSARRL